MKRYVVDLGAIEVEARNADEAYMKVFNQIGSGETPIEIVNVDIDPCS